MRLRYAAPLGLAALALSACASGTSPAAQPPVPVASAWRPGLFVEGYGPVGLGPSPSDSTLSDPVQASLAGVGLQESQLGSGLTLALAADGTSLDQPSITYCDGTFASEAARVARRRTVLRPAGSVPDAASEAVYYRTPQDASTALSELRAAAAACPSHRTVTTNGQSVAYDAVEQAVDETGLVPAAQRVVIAYDVTPATGTPFRSLRVWQQRGRVLVGVFYGGASTTFTDTDRGNVHLLTSGVAERLDALESSFTGTA